MTKTQLDETQPIEKTNTTVWNDPLIVCSNMVKREMAAKEKNEDCRRPRRRWSAALLSCIASSSAASPRFSRSNSSSTAWKPTGHGHVTMLKPQSAIAATHISFTHVHLQKYACTTQLSNMTIAYYCYVAKVTLPPTCTELLMHQKPVTNVKPLPADVRSSAPSPCYTHLP